MFDFDLDFDEFEIDMVQTSHKRKIFKLQDAVDNLDKFVIPDKKTEVRMISPAYGFSSCALIMKIAAEHTIRNMFASTLRVGKKEMNAICGLMADGTIENSTIILSGLSKENNVNGKDYGYQKYFEDMAEQYGLNYRYKKNHSKVILLDLEDDDYIVIETSSNLNENPKIEQFCVINDKKVYDFYLKIFDELLK